MNKQQKNYINSKFENLKLIMRSPEGSSDRDDAIIKILEEIYIKGYDAGYNLGKKHGKDSETRYYLG